MHGIVRKITISLLLMLALAASSYGDEKRTLILYFSMPEQDAVDAVSGASRIVEKGRVVGNVEWVARVIQSSFGGDICSLATVQLYPAKHAPLVEYATAERKTSARPKLKALDVDIDSYDVIFLGYPIWWSDLPMPLYTFLESYDLKGKTVVPFSTHGGSGWAGTIETLTRRLPKARVIQNGFTVSRNNVTESRSAIVSWLNGLDLTDKR